MRCSARTTPDFLGSFVRPARIQHWSDVNFEFNRTRQASALISRCSAGGVFVFLCGIWHKLTNPRGGFPFTSNTQRHIYMNFCRLLFLSKSFVCLESDLIPYPSYKYIYITRLTCKLSNWALQRVLKNCTLTRVSKRKRWRGRGLSGRETSTKRGRRVCSGGFWVELEGQNWLRNVS